ncbi:MAG: helix-turn-helix domain-containing protein [Bacillota bacterium]
MIDRKFLGNEIKERRKYLGFTQYELSRITNLSRNYISDIENGRYCPSIQSLSRIAVVLELDLNVIKMTEIQVLGGEEKNL